MGFIVVDKSAIKIKKILEKSGKIALDERIQNAIIYNINKTRNMLFFKARK